MNILPILINTEEMEKSLSVTNNPSARYSRRFITFDKSGNKKYKYKYSSQHIPQKKDKKRIDPETGQEVEPFDKVGGGQVQSQRPSIKQRVQTSAARGYAGGRSLESKLSPHYSTGVI